MSALYTSPYPPGTRLRSPGRACFVARCCRGRPQTTHSAATTSATPTPSRHRLPRSRLVPACPSSFRRLQPVWFDHPRRCASDAALRPQQAAEERRDSVAGDQHPDDDRRAEDDELPPDCDAEDQQHLVQQRQGERCHPGRGRARQPARERRAGDDDGGDRREQVGGPERRVDADPDAGEQHGRDRVERAGRRVGEDDVGSHVDAGHPRGSRICATAWKRRPGAV